MGLLSCLPRSPACHASEVESKRSWRAFGAPASAKISAHPLRWLIRGAGKSSSIRARCARRSTSQLLSSLPSSPDVSEKCCNADGKAGFLARMLSRSPTASIMNSEVNSSRSKRCKKGQRLSSNTSGWLLMSRAFAAFARLRLPEVEMRSFMSSSPSSNSLLAIEKNSMASCSVLIEPGRLMYPLNFHTRPPMLPSGPPRRG
eukprot:scaffold626_cov137-Pinguiococcus_pyrenoidosus.AAC.3